MDREYFNGKVYKDTIILYRLQGNRIIEDRISSDQFPWYFCISKDDYTAHKDLINDFKDGHLIQSLKDEGNYVRIYCENKNLWPDDDDLDAKTQILEEFNAKGIQTYEADLNSCDRYVIDHDIKITDKHYIGYYDIETKDTNPEITIGKEPILSISVIDHSGNRYFFCSDDEKRMLRSAVEKLAEFTMLVGWYSKSFDWDYIKERCKVHDIKFPLWHINHVDMMEWFKEAVSTGGIKDKVESFSLDRCSNQFIGKGKTEGVGRGHGAIWKLFQTDRKKLVEYNLTDCMLMKELDDKLHITDQIIKQSVICGCFIAKASHSKLTDSFLLRLSRDNHIRLPSKKDIQPRLVKPPGGRVFIKKPGIYGPIKTFDFSGYYNSIMRTFNMGPDTILTMKDYATLIDKSVPKILSPYTYLNLKIMRLFYNALIAAGIKFRIDTKEIDYIKVPVFTFNKDQTEAVEACKVKVHKHASKYFTLHYETFLTYFFKENRKNNVMHTYKVTIPEVIFFRKDQQSIVVKALETYVNERNKYKKYMEELIKKKVSEKDPEYVSTEIMINVFKLLGNIVYGQMGYFRARIYHYCIPPSICLGGQTITHWTSEWFKDGGYEVIYNDTDSNYVIAPSVDPEDKLTTRLKTEYHPFIHQKIQEAFHCDPKKISVKLDFEKVYSRIVLVSKKRYAGNLVWKSGETKNKIDIKGLEFVRRETINLAAQTQKKMMEMLLTSPKIPTGEDCFKWISKVKDDFFNTKWTKDNIRDITKRVVVSKYAREYKSQPLQSIIVERMGARGQNFELGSILEYVLLKRSGTRKEGEEVSYYLETKDKITTKPLAFDEYWNVEIYSKVMSIFKFLFPELPWLSLDTDIAAKANKRFMQLMTRINKKNDREKTLRMIYEYTNFDFDRRMILLDKFKSCEQKDHPDSKLIKTVDKIVLKLKSNYDLDKENDT
jgi:DNA polymerase elongation subunit (family B)